MSLTGKKLREGKMCIRLAAEWRVGFHHWHPHEPKQVSPDDAYETWECCACGVNREFRAKADPNDGGWAIAEF